MEQLSPDLVGDIGCPGCGNDVLWASGDEQWLRGVCDRCGSCWDCSQQPWSEVDSIACSGCSQRSLCESRPTNAVLARSRTITLLDGSDVIVRPLVARDRAELARAYDQLSEQSRRRRFFSPPKRLSRPVLDQLTDLDDDRRFGLVAYVDIGLVRHGLGVARWVRDRNDRGKADAAVTVVDEWQGRGLGTELLIALIAEATAHGITTFTADVLWENEPILTPLKALGARVGPREPGVAQVEFDLPESVEEFHRTALKHYFTVVAADNPPGSVDKL